MKLRRCILLGGSGFIGRRILSHLMTDHPGLELYAPARDILDLGVPDDIQRLEPLLDSETGIIFCAAVKRQRGDTLAHFEQNLALILPLLHLCQRQPPGRFILLSSTAVYGEDIPYTRIDEQTAPQPRSYYGVAKYTTEQLLQKSFETMPERLLILRPPAVYGSDDTSMSYGPALFVHSLMTDGTVTLWGDGAERRAHLFVEDLAHIVSLLLLTHSSGILNVAQNQSWSFIELASQLASLLRVPLTVLQRTRTRRQVDHLFDDQRLRTALPDFEFTDLAAGLRSLIPQQVSEAPRVVMSLRARPIASHYRRDGQEPFERYSSALEWEEEYARVHLNCAAPISSLVPRFEWMTSQEPEGHLDALAERILDWLPTSELRCALGLSAKDDSLLMRLEGRGWSIARLNPRQDLGLTAPLAGMESIQEALTPGVAAEWVRLHWKADLVVARHLLEHVFSLPVFLAAARTLLSHRGVLLIEVPDATRPLCVHDYSMLWEEHRTYFTPTSLHASLEAAGFRTLGVSRFEYPLEDSLVLLAVPTDITRSVHLDARQRRKEYERVLGFGRSFLPCAQSIQRRLGEWSSRGLIVMLGAGHLSSTWIALMEVQGFIAYVIDDNPHKQGLLMPGTEIPILPRSALETKAPALLLLGLNPMNEERAMESLTWLEKRGTVLVSIFPGSSRYLGADG